MVSLFTSCLIALSVVWISVVASADVKNNVLDFQQSLDESIHDDSSLPKISRAGAPMFVNIVVRSQSIVGSFSGNEQHKITPREWAAIGISDSKLKSAVRAYWARADGVRDHLKPNCEVSSCTPNSNTCYCNAVPQRFDISDLRVNIRPAKGSTFTSSSYGTRVNETRIFNHFSENRKFTADISQYVENSIQSKWLNAEAFSVPRIVNYVGTQLSSGETLFRLRRAWGSGARAVQRFMIKSPSDTVELGPRQSVTATLSATKMIVRARIFYEVSLSGFLGVYYNSPFKGRNDWALPISGVGISVDTEIEERVEIEYIYKPTVKFSNKSRR